MGMVTGQQRYEQLGTKESIIQLKEKKIKDRLISNAKQQEKVDHITLGCQFQNLHPSLLHFSREKGFLI